MRHFVLFVVIVLFFIWILPLGIFIKPSQEKIVCDGQRAMCLCSAMVTKVVGKPMALGTSLKAGASTNKENSSGGFGHYFVSAKSKDIQALQLVSFLEKEYLCYKNPYLASLEHVPKA